MQTEAKPITDGQRKEAGELFTKPWVEHGITNLDYQNTILEDPAFKALLQQSGDYARQFIVRRDSVSPHLFVNSLPKNTAKSNTSLVFDWSKRGTEEGRLGLLTQALKGADLGITELTIVDSVVAMPSWQTCLVVSPVDLLLQQGIDPATHTDEQYCNLVRPLCAAIPGVTHSDYFDGCLKKDGARLEAKTLKAWLTLPTTQKKGEALIVRRMAVNPAIQFDHNGTVYSYAPMHGPEALLNLPVGNKVKKVYPGDLIVLASLFISEPHLIDQIKAGTCPRTDVPGTELRYGAAFSGRPSLVRSDGRGWLVGFVAGSAREYFGLLGCAGE